jgi:ribosomal protein S18 acetylase RimI-like enzyme
MDLLNVKFREIIDDDFDVLKSLHEEFFPVRYADSFYKEVCEHRGVNGGTLFTRVALSASNNEVIGFVIAQLFPMNECDDKDLFTFGYEAKSVCYILTLGLKKDYRRIGLGSKLISFCIDYSCSNPYCGAVSSYCS